MAEPSRTGANETLRTVQSIMNTSFDQQVGLNAVEIVAFDSTTNSIKRITTDALSFFGTNDLAKVSSAEFYEGLEDADGNWQVVHTTIVDNVTSNRWATVKNNSTYLTYATAWADRATLNYDTYGGAF